LLKVVEDLLLIIDHDRRIDHRRLCDWILDGGRLRDRNGRARRLVWCGCTAENVAQAEPDNGDANNSCACDGDSFLCLQAHGDSSPIRPGEASKTIKTAKQNYVTGAR
jgi:hypothetical protein